MKKVVICLLACLIVVPCLSMAKATGPKIVVVNMMKLIKAHPGTSKAEKMIKDKAGEFQDQKQRMIDDYKTLQGDIEEMAKDARSTALSDSVRAERTDKVKKKLDELKDMETNIRNTDMKRRQEIEDMSARARDDLVGDIKAIIQKFAKEHDYTLIIDSSQNVMTGSGMVIYNTDELDITDEIAKLVEKL